MWGRVLVALLPTSATVRSAIIATTGDYNDDILSAPAATFRGASCQHSFRLEARRVTQIRRSHSNGHLGWRSEWSEPFPAQTMGYRRIMRSSRKQKGQSDSWLRLELGRDLR